MRQLIASLLIAAAGLSPGLSQSAEKVKTYRHTVFSVAVPMDWGEKPGSSEETVILGSRNKKDQLTVSVMYDDGPQAATERRRAFERYLEIRLDAEKAEAKGKLMLTKPQVREQEHYVFTKFGGYEKEINRRFIALITMEKGKLLTFYVESLATSDDHVNALASQIFDSIEVH